MTTTWWERVLIRLAKGFLNRYIAILYRRKAYYTFNADANPDFRIGAALGVDYAAMFMEELIAYGESDLGLSPRQREHGA